MAVTMDEVCAFAATLPRSSEALVRGRVKFRVGRIVFLAFSKDGSVMGFGFPKAWRAALVEAEPEKFSLPGEGDMRYSWVHARLDRLEVDEMHDLIENAWALCAPKRVVEEYAAARGYDVAPTI
ncbi:MAG TPA: MmcQ/YjbR family DNA-binding protein [Gaiellaceae bacterium]|nr:MmcQ/YjbR family DNA-binding protein [Gaiellaceae bacterium]